MMFVWRRLVLSEQQKRLFETLSVYCDKYAEQIPVTFVLGTSTLSPRIFASKK